MFLVDDDQAEALERQEQGRARADRQPDLAGGHAFPHPSTLGVADMGVPLRHRYAEAALQPLHHRLGQGDFGQQDQHLGGRIVA